MLHFIRDFEEFENVRIDIPSILHNTIEGELYEFKTHLDPEFYSKDDIDLYGPEVIVMSHDEFENIENIVSTITKDAYELKEVVGLEPDAVYTRYSYIFNNGNSWISLYVITNI